jgi:AraC family transcriptional regulator, transcriptional activator of the genes for pyochelin and ferripyochelin receptors
MQAIEYSKLLDSTIIRTLVPTEAIHDEGIYQRDDGIQFRSRSEKHCIFQEIVRLGDAAFLFASQDRSRDVAPPHYQVVHDGDWIHIQFRLSGGGREDIARAGVVETPESSCIIARYPQNSVIERTVSKENGWKVACLFVKPTALTRLMDVSAPTLPECVLWLALEEHLELRSRILPLQSSMKFAVNDILNCRFRGCSRRAYMRAKSLELLSSVIHALDVDTSICGPTLRLSESDYERISLARSVMTADLESTLTLAELAHRVGLNRTKLALGFKGVYGISVQAFWRDARLDRAREMLRDCETPVTEVALSLGYAELSSFTRAFTRKFGVVPRNCRTEADRVLSKEPTKSV